MSDGVRRYFPVSWDELHRDARALSWRLAERGPFAGIVAVTRGGLVPAHIVARELCRRMRRRGDRQRKVVAGDGLTDRRDVDAYGQWRCRLRAIVTELRR